MGTKFGNIHVITKNKNEVISALKDISSGKSQNHFNIELLSGFESLLQEINQSKNVYYLGELRPGWVSVLNNSFGWGEVEAIGEELSSYINSPIITISYFEIDFVFIGTAFSISLRYSAFPGPVKAEMPAKIAVR